MKEQFDKRLVEKIRDSFENHEEAFDPVQWDKFSQSYFNKPAKRRKLAYWPFWISGVAASLLLVFLFFPFEKEIEQGVSTLKETITSKSKSLDHITKPSETLTLKKGEQQVSNAIQPPTQSPDTGTDSGLEQSEREKQDAIQIGKDPGFKGIALSNKGLSLELPSASILPPGGAVNSEEKVEQASPQANAMDSESAQAWVEEWKNGVEDKATEGKSETIIKNDKPKNPFRLGVVAGPQAASNPVSGMQFGGGVMSEFSLSDKLKVDIGVTYAHQSIEPDQSSKLPETMTLRASNAMEASSFTNDYLGSEYTLSYSGLDIPINLKYKVMDKSNAELYLITGLSSMVYLDQKGKEVFSVASKFSADFTGALQYTESVQQFSQEYTPSEGQSNLDLGKMLNLSFGYEYNLKNGTFISIEPYYKLPLGDLTFTNQQFSIGGLNLRMNFQFKK